MKRIVLPIFAAVSLILGLAAVPAGAAALVPPSPNLYDQARVGLGEFTAVCDYTGLRDTIDPIVAPGSTTFMHAHDFFGNTEVTADSTPTSLRENSDTNCDPVEDASSYWIPSLVQNGQPLDATSLTAYYFVKSPMDPAQVQEMPADMKMIAGNAKATSPQPLNRIAWTCFGSSEMRSTIPDCNGRTLQLALFFPQCWDGVNTDSPDHISHVAYSQPGVGCPESHPYLIPQLELQFRWQPEPGAQLDVSSDPMAGQSNGITAHADFVNGWELATLKERTDNCLRWPVVCLINGVDRRISQGSLPPDLVRPPTPVPPPLPGDGPSPTPNPTASPSSSPTPSATPSPEPSDEPTRSAFERIESESFDDQVGVRTENTSDAGGGENIGYLANDDWARYDRVDFGEGADEVTARLASAVDSEGQLEVRLDAVDGPLVASVPMKNTGGWQSWESVDVPLTETVTGVHDLYLRVANQPSWQEIGNVNWLTFNATDPEPEPTPTSEPSPTEEPTPTPTPEPTVEPARSAFDRIEAESFDDQTGVLTEGTSDNGGGDNVGWLANGDWTRYDRVDFGEGATEVDLRVASAVTTNGQLEMRLDSVDGPRIASVAMPNTGGWQSWRTVTAELSESVSGVHDLYLVVVNDPAWQDVGNVNWLTFAAAQPPEYGLFYGEGRVDDRAFWDDQRGIGFSVSSQGAYPGQQRLEDALQRVSDLGYTTIRTWGAGGYAERILQTIDDMGLDLKVQVGVWISTDSGSRGLLDAALATVEGHEEHVMSLSLGNEQLADWNSSDMTPPQLADQIDYVRERSTVPLTYNFSDATFREGSSFWSRGGAEVLPLLDYVNMHDYGATFANNNRWNPGYTPADQLEIIRSDSDWVDGLFDSLDMSTVPVVLGETGWQSSGYSSEVTNTENAAAYAEGVASYLYNDDSRFDSMYYFNFSDESWKGGDDHWGLYREGNNDSLGNAKYDLAELRSINLG